MTTHSTTHTPTCSCGDTIRARQRELGIDATVSHLPPLVPTPYQPYIATCPHGVPWYSEPTSEQRMTWARDGVL